MSKTESLPTTPEEMAVFIANALEDACRNLLLKPPKPPSDTATYQLVYPGTVRYIACKQALR